MKITVDEAQAIGDELGVDWKQIDLGQFRRGLEVEYEHIGTIKKLAPNANVTLAVASIAIDHLNEWPDYYTRLMKVER